MRIQRIETLLVTIPLHEPSVLARSRHEAASSFVVRLHMDNGIVGLGEARLPGPGLSPETLESMRSIIENHWGPRLMGMDAMELEGFVAILDSIRTGNTFVRAALDIALHDAMGQQFGVPIHTLLGGARRNYVDLIGWIGIDSPEAMAEKAVGFVSEGYRTLKLKIGTEDFRADVERVRRVRESVGSGVHIRVDANGAYNAATALKVTRAIEPFDVQLMEDPLEEWDLRGTAEVARAADIPICVDAAIRSPQDAFKVIAGQVGDIIKIKLVKVGGFTNARKIVAIAEAAGTPVIVGRGTCGDIEATAELHLFATVLPTGLAGEMVGPTKLVHRAVDTPMLVENGSASVPSTPGLGLKLRDDYAQALGSVTMAQEPVLASIG